MKEQEKAEELAHLLDALANDEDLQQAPTDPEVRELAELGRSLYQARFEPGPVHRAAVERMVLDHRRVGRQASQARQTSRRRWVPFALLAGTTLALLMCVLLAAVGGGLTWWQLRDAGGDEVIAKATEIVEMRTIAPERTATPEQTPAMATRETRTPSVVPSATPTTAPAVVIEPLSPVTARLQAGRGLIEIQTDQGGWSVVGADQTLEVGDRVRTGALSAVDVAFYDGSVAHLGPETELSIDLLTGEASGAGRVIELSQWSGESRHDVVPNETEGASYRVHTPAGTGEAKGTVFAVVFGPAMAVHFSVHEGAVSVSHLGTTVLVVAGQLTLVDVDTVPSEPVFRVIGEGQVTQTGITWEVAGQSFATDAHTVIVGNPQVGDWVLVEGYLLPDGTRVADRIVLLRRAVENRFAITGEVDQIGDQEWIVAGQQIAIGDETGVDVGIEPGDMVHVEGTILDGALLAAEIRLIETEPYLAFSFVGVVQEMDETGWTISGVTVAINEDTTIESGLGIGDVVLVRGVSANGDWLARSIARLAEGEQAFEFTGIVEETAPWTVSGIVLETDLQTEIEAGIDVGDRVRVEGRLLPDGTWLADEIERIDEDQELGFEFVGIVDEMSPWVVSGRALQVDKETEIQGQIEIGMLVRVEGQILPGGDWLATEIVPLSEIWPGAGCVKLVAVVLDAGPDAIVLGNGVDIELADTIIVQGELTPGAVIELWVCVDNEGRVQVVSITVIYWIEPGEIPVPTPDVIPTVAPPPSEGGQVTICHKPGTPAEKTMTIPREALPGHLAHGDTIGPCK